MAQSSGYLSRQTAAVFSGSSKKKYSFPLSKSFFAVILIPFRPFHAVYDILPVYVPVLIHPCQRFHIEVITPQVALIHSIVVTGIVRRVIRIGAVKH
mgnify:CR=1 FL=1